MYFLAKDTSPGRLSSLYEIGYMIMGRKSIYWISLVIFVTSFLLTLVYLIVFGDICASIVTQLFYDGKKRGWFSTRVPYVLILGLALSPLILKKELKELRITALTLFLGVSAFLVLLVAELIFEGSPQNHDTEFDYYYEVDQDLSLVKGVSIIFVSFAFQQNLFPVYNSLKV